LAGFLQMNSSMTTHSAVATCISSYAHSIAFATSQ
jgi:hypothetical protein